MTCQANKSGLRRWLADFALAFALFWAVALAVSAGHTGAHAIALPALGKDAIVGDSIHASAAGLRIHEANHALQTTHKAQTSPEQALLLLSLAFAAMTAFNIGFWRHLRRVYASPRRSVWRRG